MSAVDQVIFEGGNVEQPVFGVDFLNTSKIVYHTGDGTELMDVIFEDLEVGTGIPIGALCSANARLLQITGGALTEADIWVARK